MEEKELVLDDSLFEPLDSSEKNNEFIAIESKTYLQDAWRRFKKNKLALFGLIFLILITLAAIIIPMVSPFTYDGQDLANRNALPNMVHLMGTDKLGRDIMVRVMYGARISLTIGFVAAFLNLIIGVIYGGISGFVGGKVDMVMMRIGRLHLCDSVDAVRHPDHDDFRIEYVFGLVRHFHFLLGRHGPAGPLADPDTEAAGILDGGVCHRRQ